jgi:hypothetical protein
MEKMTEKRILTSKKKTTTTTTHNQRGGENLIAMPTQEQDIETK